MAGQNPQERDLGAEPCIFVKNDFSPFKWASNLMMKLPGFALHFYATHHFSLSNLDCWFKSDLKPDSNSFQLQQHIDLLQEKKTIYNQSDTTHTKQTVITPY